MQNHSDSILRKVFGRRAETALKALAGTAQVQNLLAEVEAQEATHRAELIDRLRTAPQRHEATCVKAYQQMEAARQRLKSAEDAVTVASVAYVESQRLVLSLGTTYEREKAQLVTDIEASAHPSIEKFATACDQLAGQLRIAPLMVHQEHLTHSGTMKITFSSAEMSAAIEVVRASARRARALKLEALADSVVKERLSSIATELALALRPINKQAPSVSDDVAAGVN